MKSGNVSVILAGKPYKGMNCICHLVPITECEGVPKEEAEFILKVMDKFDKKVRESQNE